MADFQANTESEVKTHDAVAVAASGTSAKTIDYREVPDEITVVWNITGTGTPEVKVFDTSTGADVQLGTTQTTATGKLTVTDATRHIKVQVKETGALTGITATVVVTANN